MTMPKSNYCPHCDDIVEPRITKEYVEHYEYWGAEITATFYEIECPDCGGEIEDAPDDYYDMDEPSSHVSDIDNVLKKTCSNDIMPARGRS